MWELVVHGYIELYDEVVNTQKDQLRVNRKKDERVLFSIQNGIYETIFPNILEKKISKIAWDILYSLIIKEL